MLINNFSGIKLEFDGLYYGGNYEIEIFPDGRFYYSYIENTSVELKKGSFQINQKEIMIFEEMMSLISGMECLLFRKIMDVRKKLGLARK